MLNYISINFRRSGEIEEAVAAKVLGCFDLREPLGELRVRFLVSVVPGTIVKVSGEFAPLLGSMGPTSEMLLAASPREVRKASSDMGVRANPTMA